MDWISVRDALPEENKHVLITVRYKDWDSPVEETGGVLRAICTFSKEHGWRVLQEPELIMGDDGTPQTIENYDYLWIKWKITHWMYWPDPAPFDDGLRPFNTEILREGETIK